MPFLQHCRRAVQPNLLDEGSGRGSGGPPERADEGGYSQPRIARHFTDPDRATGLRTDLIHDAYERGGVQPAIVAPARGIAIDTADLPREHDKQVVEC